ncbi:MAG TPA: CRTAC1 family protein [Thermoanaerobaculia bacterium]|nr:CRTAC1 family protein [Thermoanaerobaculia bacterium]
MNDRTTEQPQPHRPTRRRLHFWTAVAIALALVVVVGAVLGARHIDERAACFLTAGRSLVTTLHTAADGLDAGSVDPLAAALASDFRGRSLGLTEHRLVDRRDGIARWHFAPARAEIGRDDALTEWRHYLAGFAEIEDAILGVHRLESWSDPADLVATVRYELLGRSAGAGERIADRALFRLRFRLDGRGGAEITSAEGLEGVRSSGGTPHFEEVGRAAGIDFANRFYPAFLDRPLAFAMLRYGPAGITAFDDDGDGFHDLFVPDGVDSRLFHNRRDGSFEDVTDEVGLGGLSGVSVGLFADYDNDGDKDLFVSRTFEPNQLFERRDDGRFHDVTARSGIGADCCTTAASWADIDNDGDLDLYVCRYLDPQTEIPTTFYARNGEPNRLYRNDGEGRFTDITESAGVGDTGLCLGSVFGDYDDDGHADLYVVNDFGRNTLYRNRGDGTFEDVTVEANALAYGAGMSASFGDYDNDGLLDIYVANIRSESTWIGEQPAVDLYLLNNLRQGLWWQDAPLFAEIVRQSGFRFKEVFQQMGSGNTLLRNRGDGRFEDVTWQAGANPPGWFWGSGFADFDNDGWQDLYSTNGWVYGEPGTEIELDFYEGVVQDQRLYKTGHFFDPTWFEGRSWHGWERNRHLRNERDGTFTEIGWVSGSDLLLNSRGIAVADFWNRGVVDIAVAASTDRHALLANRLGGRRNWLQVELVGGAAGVERGSNRDAVGARLEIRVGDRRQAREVVLGDGYGSQNMLRQHFGLGSAGRVDELSVRWPRSGAVQRFRDLPVNRIVRIVEGRDGWLEVDYARRLALDERASLGANPAGADEPAAVTHEQ